MFVMIIYIYIYITYKGKLQRWCLTCRVLSRAINRVVNDDSFYIPVKTAAPVLRVANSVLESESQKKKSLPSRNLNGHS